MPPYLPPIGAFPSLASIAKGVWFMKKATMFSILAAVTLSPPAIAAQPVQTLRISLDGVDLETSRGVAVVQRRIDRTIAAYCRNGIEHMDFKARRAARECREALRAKALAQLDGRRAARMAVR